MSAPRADRSTLPGNLPSLTRLRWAAIAGQVATILVVHAGMGIALPLGPLALVIAIEASSNVLLRLWLRTRGTAKDGLIAATMALDVVLLTALLFYTGGPFNPFSFLYLVHIALAAVVLPARWTWALVALSLLCSGGLFYGHRWLDLDASHAQSHAEHMQMHLQGMWIACAVAAGFIATFVTRVRRELTAQRVAAARNERLASLATLAAGAAHELATPLGTIAVAVREIERRAEAEGAASLEDARLIRAQVERCRAILLQLSADAGQGAGEAPERTALSAIVARAVGDASFTPQVAADLGECAATEVVVPPRIVAQAVRAIVKNAEEASASASATPAPITVTAAPAPRGVTLVIRDRGPGMTADTLAHAGEPFFTTKAPGRGMGLGLFLARTVVERLGGALQIESSPGAGTAVTILLPVEAPE